MAVALTTYFANAASNVLATANQLYYANSGSGSTTQCYVTIGNNVTGFGELPAQGAASGWAASGSIGSPTGKGFFLSALKFQQIVAGNWSAAIRLNAAQGSGTPQAGTLTGDIYVRAFNYSLGVYTQIVSMVLAAQTLNTTFTTYTLPSTAASASIFTSQPASFLYIDCWFNCLTNANANALQGIRFNRLTTDLTSFKGDTGGQVVTPGYIPAVPTVLGASQSHRPLGRYQ
ncbi:MAG TPA: hypothetical protein VHL10_00795 [Nitrososphaera sp.]|jgi:hypothetical protein|nr:hypothetical protein [Nitrososphaera sp.]